MAHRKKTDAAVPDVELPITPMLDMAFQLLAFFVFTYHPSALEGQIGMSLPTDLGRGTDERESVVTTSPEPGLELPAEITILIKTRRAEGSEHTLFQYLVETREGTTPPMSDGPDSRAIDKLEKYLIEARETLTNKDEVKIVADGGLKYAFVMEVMDVCHHPRKGGFKRVGFASPHDVVAN